MRDLSRKEVLEKIERVFGEKEISSKEVKKIKTIAMAHRIRLKEYRKRFCKKCYVDLKLGRVRVSKTHKQVICGICGTVNRWKI